MKAKYCAQVQSPSGNLLEVAYAYSLRELRIWFNEGGFDVGSSCQVYYGGEPFCEWCL